MSTRIALHYHIAFSVKEGLLYCPAYYGVWVESIAKRFDEVLVIAYTCKHEKNSYLIHSNNVSLLDLGFKPKSLFKRISQFRLSQKLITDKLDTFDCVGIRAPTPLAIFVYWVVRRKPVFFLLVGNYWRMVRFTELAIWKKLLLTTYWWIDHQILSYAANQSVVFAIGKYFTKEFPRINNMNNFFTSTIYKKDIVQKPKVYNKSNRLKLIFVGRVELDKGVEYIIQAMGQLKNSGFDIELIILGTASKAEKKRLELIAIKFSVSDLVSFIGFVPQGEMFREYISWSDIMVIPSVWDFQTRAIWEGMAGGLPIIASRGIKSLPLQFKHKEEIYFIDAGNTEQLHDAVIDLMNNPHLYQTLSVASIRIANDRTVELSTDLLIKKLKNTEKFRALL